MKQDEHGYEPNPMILEPEPYGESPSPLDAARQTVREVADRLHVMQQERLASVTSEPTASSSAVVTLGHEVASLRDEMTSLAADVVLLAADQRGTPELERQVAGLAAQCTDLPALRAVVARLEQDLEMRMQAPAPRLDRVVCELQAETARIADTARGALAEVRALSVATTALEARLGMLEQRLGSWMDERQRSPLIALQELAAEVVAGVRTRVVAGLTGWR